MLSLIYNKEKIMELFKAHAQWKSRPVDERFKSVQEMHGAVTEYRNSAVGATMPYNDLRVEAVNGEVKLVGKSGTPATLTHWSMGQLSQRAGAPAHYLRSLPAELAVKNLNHGLEARNDANDQAQLLFHQNGSLILRAATSEVYDRIWNNDITGRLIRLQENNPNWTNPMAYKVLAPGTDGQWPTMSQQMERAGLYASDHDMFAFLVDESKTLEGGPQGLNRGFFVWNSEVGASSFGFMAFLYDRVCGNNIVWGATDVQEFRIRHTAGASDKAFGQLAVELKKYSESATGQIETMIKQAKAYELGATKEDVLDRLFGLAAKLKTPELNKTRLTQAVELAEQRTERYGNPYSMWGVVSGLTEASQWLSHTDDRVKIDKAAGKLLKTISF